MVYTVLENEHLLDGEWHMGVVVSVISAYSLSVKINGSSTAQTVACNPNINFVVGDHVFVHYINGSSSDKYVPYKRATGTESTANLAGTTVPWTDVTSTPTTLAGYGITNPIALTTGATFSGAVAFDSSVTLASGQTLTNSGTITGGTINASSVPWTGVTGTPTTLAGYGITNGQVALGYTPLNEAGGTMSGQLVVNQGSNIPSLLLEGASTGWASGLQLSNTGTGGRNYGIYSGSDGSWHFADVISGTDRLIINSAGNATFSGNVNANTLQRAGYTVWDANNLPNPFQTTGGTISGAVTLSAALSLNAGATIASATTVTNNGTISGGTVNATTLQRASYTVWDAGNLPNPFQTTGGTVTGATTFSSSVTLNAGATIASSTTVTNNGTISGGTFSGTHTGNGSGLTGIGTQSLATDNQWLFRYGATGSNTWLPASASYIPQIEDVLLQPYTSVLLNDTNSFTSSMPQVASYNAVFTTYVYCSAATTWSMGTVTVDANFAIYLDGNLVGMASDYGVPPTTNGVTGVQSGGTISVSLPIGWSRIDFAFSQGSATTCSVSWTGSSLSTVVEYMTATPWISNDIQPSVSKFRTRLNVFDDGSANATINGSSTFNGAMTLASGQTFTNNGTITGGTINATSVPWTGVTSHPTTIAGYGITDALAYTTGTTFSGAVAFDSSVSLAASQTFTNSGTISGGTVNATTLQRAGYTAWDAGNLPSPAQTTGATFSGAVTFNGSTTINNTLYTETIYNIPNGTATSTSAFGSYGFQFQNSTWNGTAATTNFRNVYLDYAGNFQFTGYGGGTDQLTLDTSGNLTAKGGMTASSLTINGASTISGQLKLSQPSMSSNTGELLGAFFSLPIQAANSAGSTPQPNTLGSFLGWYHIPTLSIGIPGSSTVVTNFEPGGQQDYFIGVISGYITVPTTGSYTFELDTDDGGLVWLGGSLIINNWNYEGIQAQGSGVKGTVSLTANIAYPISITWFQGGGGAAVEFWVDAVPSGSTQTVPAIVPSAWLSWDEFAVNQGLDYMFGTQVKPITVLNTTQLGGVAASNFVRNDSGASNPQVIANGMQFNSATTFEANAIFNSSLNANDSINVNNFYGISLQNLQKPSSFSFTATNGTSGTVGTNLAASTEYTYGIVANGSGGQTALLATVSVTTGATAYPVSLAWTAIPNAVSYTIYKNTGTTSPYSAPNVLVSGYTGGTSYVDSGSVSVVSSSINTADSGAHISGATMLSLASSQGDSLLLYQDNRDDGDAFRFDYYEQSTNAWNYGILKLGTNIIFNAPTYFNSSMSLASGQTFTNSGTITGGTINASSVPWSGVTGTPTTVSGYGITNAITTGGGQTISGTLTATTFVGALSGNASTATNVAWTGVTGTPTTLAGYGITNPVALTTGSTFTGTTTFEYPIYINEYASTTWNSQIVASNAAGNYFTDTVANDLIFRNETNNDILFGFTGASGAQHSTLRLSYPYTVQTFNNTLDDGSGNIRYTGTLTVPNARQNMMNFVNVSMDSVDGNEIVYRGMNQFRFSDGTEWDWNHWGGIRWQDTTNTMIIGASSSNYFNKSNNGTVGQMLFDGLSKTSTNGAFQVIGSQITTSTISAPTGLTAANATTGTVGTYIVASTQYVYEITSVAWDGTETTASSTVSVTTGATAYPINLSWTAPSNNVLYVNIYKNGNFLAQVYNGNVPVSSYQDAGSVATTTQVPPSVNNSGSINIGGNASFSGTVTLSGSPTSSLEAATKEYVDTATSAATVTLNSYKNTVTLSSASSTVTVGISQFVPSTDTLLVYENSVYIEVNQDYTLNSSGVITNSNGTWNSGTVFNFIVMKVAQGSPTGTIDGSLLQSGSVGDNALSNDIEVRMWMGI